ncbi:MAG: chemotaxis protein CheA [Burkholderiaceae bacterium]|jgi:two-component system chemotaxis sensor kinase CheA|nr:chemotaxis protein CheA [Burkholderiaceae bacterium]
MNVDMSQFFQVFFDETDEHLAEQEKLLLNIDLDHPDQEDINAIFRAAHSIKGGAATFGFTDMADVGHVMESLLDEIRQGNERLTSGHVEAFLEAKDVLKMLRDAHQLGSEVDHDAVEQVMKHLKALSYPGNAPGGVEEAAGQEVQESESGAGLTSYEITLPAMDAVQLEALTEELETLGTIERETTPDGNAILKLTSGKTRDDIISICAFVLNPDDVHITEVALSSGQDSADTRTDDERGYGFFNNITLPYRRESNPEAVRADEAARRKSETGGATQSRTSSHQQLGAASIRVGTEKVDQLINLVGELVITHAMIEQQAGSLDPMVYQRLLDSLSQLSRNSRDLQHAVMSMRMLPMEYAFSRFPRMVHDLAGKLGKKVELVTAGAATELDKGLIERIIDPLTHLVRNSVDHGIELPEERKAAGKNEVGRLYLSASHQGGNIVIEVNDDGAGLDRDRIMDKAREKGLPVSDNMSDAEVWNLIFLPGFSTSSAVTEVSGRGVGMDVVRRNVSEMGGFLDIRSAHGMGTMLSIYLPLTLAILDGMSIRTGDEIYILPLGNVVESLQPEENDIKEVSGEGKVIKVRSEYLALLSLAEIFNIAPRAKTPSEGIVVILEADGNRAALLVDELVGQHQVVVKNLETNYRKVPNVSGATIMGDGNVALIIDVSWLLRSHNLHNDIGGF